jgi:excisionase family DNA binding protein
VVAEITDGTGSELPPERYLSRGEAARRLGVPPRTIQEWAKDGKVPCIRTLGGHRRFSARDLDALGELVKKRRARRRPSRSSPVQPV